MAPDLADGLYLRQADSDSPAKADLRKAFCEVPALVDESDTPAVDCTGPAKVDATAP